MGAMCSFTKKQDAQRRENTKLVPIVSKCEQMNVQPDPKITVRILAESDANSVRRTALEVYFPPVLTNIVLEYFSQRSFSLGTIERIYNPNEDGPREQVWEFSCDQNFSCSLSKTATIDNQCIRTQLYSSLRTHNGVTRIEIQFRENLNIYTTELLFSFIAPLCYNPDGISSQAFTFYSFIQYDFPNKVPFYQYLKFLDDGIVEFQHSALVNVKSLIDAHKNHPYFRAIV